MKVTKLATLLCALSATSFTCNVLSGQSFFNFRTTPWFVTPGAPFDVIADSTRCYILFVGQNGTFDYGGVSITGNIVEVRYGYLQDPTCDSDTYPISQQVPGLPAGSYEVRAIFQPLDDAGAEFVGPTLSLQVSSRIPGAPHSIPTLGWPSAGLCTLLVAAGAVGLMRRTTRV